MLQQMRTGAKSIVAKVFLFGLLLCAMLGLAVIGDAGLIQSGSKRNYVAKMDGHKISIQEFDRFVQQEVRARGITMDQAYLQGVPQRLLQSMVKDRLLALATRDIGIQVDDATAAIEIKKILSDAVKSGMSEKDALRTLLSQTGLSEKQLVTSIKTDMGANLVINAIAGNAHVPQMLIDDAVKMRHEVREGAYFSMTVDEIGKVSPATDEELQKLYNENKAQFMRPEYRSFAVVLLDKKALGISGVVTDADVKAYYEQHINEFKLPETRDISQIVVGDESEARKIADASKGKDLGAVVKEIGSKAMVISKSYEKAALPGEFADDVFGAKDGEIVGPVKTSMGWHVLAVGKKNAAGAESFDKVSGAIRKKLVADNGASMFYDKANAIDDMISSGKGIADISAQYNVQEKTFSKVDAQGMTEGGKKIVDVPASDKIVATAFALDEGETSQLIELPNNTGFAIVETREIAVSVAEPFDKVRDSIVDIRNLREERALLDKKSAEISEKLSMGESFGMLAESMKKKVAKAGPVNRSDVSTKPGLTRDVENALFSLQNVEEAKVFGSDGKILVVKLSSRKVDQVKAKADTDKKSMTAMLQQNAQNVLLNEYSAYLVDKYNAEIFLDVVNEMYAPKPE